MEVGMATIESATEIRLFTVEVPEEDLVDLRMFLAPYRDGGGTTEGKKQ
jgi:hypothetical protein